MSSNSSTSFAPPGESALDLWIEKSNLDGFVLSGVGYGILFTVTFQTLQLFLGQPKHKIQWGMVMYIAIVFTLASLGFAGNAKFNEMTYIEDRAFPGGPNAFTIAFYNTPVNMMSFVSYTIMSWFADGLVLWRFSLFYGYNRWIVFLPALIFMGSITSSIVLIISIFESTNTFWAARSVEFGIAYWSCSIGLNIILTTAITLKIFFLRKRIGRSLGSQGSDRYTSIAAMMIESAALYGVWSLVFIICYARNTPFQNILLPPLGQVQGIAPMLILFRVAQGRAWSSSTAHATSTGVGYQSSRGIPLTTASTAVGDSRSGVKVNIMTASDSQWDKV